MHRRWFSLLCDPEYQQLLDAEELAVIERYVPHTFDLTADNLASALADKDRLVFKRSYSYGGKEVFIGDQYSTERLRELLALIFPDWNCQRRVHTSSLELPGPDGQLLPFYFVLGMYLLWRGRQRPAGPGRGQFAGGERGTGRRGVLGIRGVADSAMCGIGRELRTGSECGA